MVRNVVLSVKGSQSYAGQEPDIIELVTEGTLEQLADGWKLSYEETELTGMQGVNTTFLIQESQITLTRTGKLSSEMIFRIGEPHDCLYRMEFGVLMLTVCATRMRADIADFSGTIDLRYSIEIEQNAAGIIDYHLEIQLKE